MRVRWVYEKTARDAVAGRSFHLPNLRIAVETAFDVVVALVRNATGMM
jgi:hypothetical protein